MCKQREAPKQHTLLRLLISELQMNAASSPGPCRQCPSASNQRFIDSRHPAEKTGSTNSWGWCLINTFSPLTAPPHILLPGRVASNQGHNVRMLGKQSCLCKNWHAVYWRVSSDSVWLFSICFVILKGASLSILALNLVGGDKCFLWIYQEKYNVSDKFQMRYKGFEETASSHVLLSKQMNRMQGWVVIDHM